LEYTVKVDDKFFSTTQQNTILNTAKATYNDTTSNIAGSEQDCSGTAKIAKSVGSIVTEDNGNSYLLYTVKVTAYGKVTNLTVKDNFTNDVVAIKELKDITTSTGSCTDPNNDKNLVWSIPSLEDKQTATLTYKAYLDLTAWDYASSVTSNDSAVQKERNIKNQADLYLGDDYIAYGTVEKKITKTWVNKTGTKDSSGKLNYTLYVNSDPVASDITSIYDQLSSDSTGATINYPITVKVYKSSTSKAQVATYSLKDPTTGFTASSTGWNLDLTTYDNGKLNGKGYYYEITYSVNGGSSSNVTNGAGINRGPDISYGEGTTIQVKTITAYKGKTAVNFRDGYVSWQSGMETDIDAGTVYTDWIDDDKVGIDGNSQWDSTGYWWYSMEDIDGVEVYQEDTLIYSKAKGVNLYDITVEPWDYTYPNDPNKRQPVTIPYWTYTVNENGTYTWTNDKTKYGKIGYYGFKVTFGKAIDVTNGGVVYIRYNSSASWENMYHFAMTKYSAATGALCYQMQTYNKSEWTLGMGATSGVRSDSLTVYNTNDVLKGSSYDATTGIITWKIYINRQGDMIGDATVEDILPAGLEYIDGSAKLSYDISSNVVNGVKNDSSGKDYIGSSFNENNRNNQDGHKYGNIKQVDGEDAVTAEKQADGTTKLTVLLENLKGFSYEGSTNYDSSWYCDGNVVLTIQTRIKDEMLLQGVDETFKNAVTVTNATMASGSASAYASQTIKQTSDDVLKKTMDNYTSGTVLTFNMDINSEGGDLIYNSDKLEIRDVMSSKMSLATHRDNYFVVTDSAGNELTAATSKDITADQYYLEQLSDTEYKIIVPDGKKLHIQYLVTVDAAVGEKVDISNKAYFVYEGLQASDTGNEVSDQITISRARGGTGTSADNPSFKIYKEDQWGNPVEGVTFALYEVQQDSNGVALYDSDGQVKLSGTAVATKTTAATGYVEFTGLKEKGVYCYVETSAPFGYVVNPTSTYFYFTYNENLGLEGAIGIDYNEKIFDVTNWFSAASLNVSLNKTINGKDQATENEFKFTLAKTSDTTGTVYSDEECTTSVDSVETSIKGSGTARFGTLYFQDVGTYTFTLSENNLTEAQGKEGFTKDATEYTIEAKVVNGSNGLYLDYARYTWTDSEGTHTGDLLNGDTPAFDNTLKLDPVTVQLTATKKLISDEATKKLIGDKGRSAAIANGAITEGEFRFVVFENGEQLTFGKTKAGYTKTGDTADYADIEFKEITFTQNDLGVHVLTIYETTGEDSTITYSKVKFYATVVVEPVPGEAKLQATVTYSTQNKDNLDENGKPVFTNTFTYHADGDLFMTGTKKFVSSEDENQNVSLKNYNFNFVVYEGKKADNGSISYDKTKTVATGKNDDNGKITFTKIDYKLSDLGEHYYCIEEVAGNDLFVEYTKVPVYVTVEVTDAGNYNLDAAVTKVNNNKVANAAAAQAAIEFTNKCIPVVASGLRLDFLPYVLIVILAGAFGVLMLMRRRKYSK
jgi:pilin isopeptide linkage protein